MAQNNHTNIAQFSSEGIDVVRDNRVLTYIYGLSDFWVSMFADTDKIDLLLGANSLTASEIYSRFLQLTAGIALEDLSEITHSQIQLEFIYTVDKVVGSVETYTLRSKLASARFLANRPFMPTSILERDVDFFIDETLGTISFAKSINDYLLPFRLNTDGSKEFSVWAVDSRMDSDLIYDNFARLIGIEKPERTSENFKNFIYGLYYLYVHGPNLDLLRRGLNLALGVPLVRDTETILEVRKYLTSDQFIVITDLNSYIIPYGLEPSVAVGDVVTTGDEIAAWVEVKDYVNDGEWWINYMIPSDLIRHIPPGNDAGGIPYNRYATENSYADYIMRNYLKTHTFLVNVKTVGFKNIQSFEELSDIIRRVKPSYTTPIYVWTVPLGNEDIVMRDDFFAMRKDTSRCATLTSGMYRFRRDSTNPLTRFCPQFTRFSVPAFMDEHTGNAEEINGYPRTFEDGTITGFIYPQKQFRNMSLYEDGWMRAIGRRDNAHYMPQASKVDFSRTLPTAVEGTGIDPISDEFPGYRLLCLYTTTMLDVLDKFEFANETVPANKYMFTLFKPVFQVDGINEVALNGSRITNFYDFLYNNFDKYFERGPLSIYLGPFAAKDNYREFKPEAADLMEEDFLVFVKIVDYTVGVFWATKNYEVRTVPYWSNENDDPLTLEVTGKLHRGVGHLGSPAYVMRGAGIDIGLSEGSSVNDAAVNQDNGPSSYVTQVNYTDAVNLPMVMDRSGKNFKIRKIVR
jgi:hypothetical protein